MQATLAQALDTTSCDSSEVMIQFVAQPSLDSQVETTAQNGHELRTFFCQDCCHSWRAPARCGDRLCRECRARDYRRIMARFGEAMAAGALRMKQPKLLTLTVLSSFDLKAQYRLLRASWRELRRQGFMLGISGGLYTIEVTYNSLTGWHCHLHALIDAPYLPQAEISEAWERLTGAPVVDIRKAWGLRKGLEYILKYMLKPPVLKEKQAQDYRLALKGARLVHGFGKFYNLANGLKYRSSCPKCGSTNIVPLAFAEHDVLEDIYSRWNNI